MIKNAIIKFFMDSPVIGYEKEDAVTRPGYIHWKTQKRKKDWPLRGVKNFGAKTPSSIFLS